MTWLLIGTAPTVTRTLPQVRLDWQIDRTITCNRGILLEPTPDVYCIVDQIACRLFKSHSQHAQRHGATLVTLNRSHDALRERGLLHFDEFLNESEWGPFRHTGPLCAEYACRHGATRLILVGCDGYRADNEFPDYFDGWTTPKLEQHDREYVHQRRTLQVMKPGFRDVAQRHPGVKFVRYGNPCFTIESGNWRDEECLSE